MHARSVPPPDSLIERATSRASIVPLRDRSIGALLVDSGRLSAANAERILQRQKERGIRFGEAAMELGILTEKDIRFALARQFEHTVLPLGDEAVAPEVVAAFQPGHRTVEALRQLRTQLQLRWLNVFDRRTCIAIVSAEAGVGRSFVAANLAVLFAQLGERTLLIDSDLRAPRQHRLFRIDNSIGLSTMLTDRAGLDSARGIEPFPHLTVLPAGPASPNPQELLARPQFARLVDNARETYDVVLIDTPAWAAGADAQIVSARSGAAILVAREGKTSIRALNDVVGSLRECKTPLVGSAVNRI